MINILNTISTIKEIIIILDYETNILFASNIALTEFSILTNKQIKIGDVLKTALIETNSLISNQIYDMIRGAINGKDMRSIIEIFNKVINSISYYDISISINERNIILMGKNATETIAIQLDLRRAKAEVEKLLNQKNEYLSRISHELKTPLNSIKGFSQLLEYEFNNEACPKNSEMSMMSIAQKEIPNAMPNTPKYNSKVKPKRYVKNIIKSCDHLMKLINDVLDIAVLDSIGVKMSLESINLNRLVFDVVELMKPIAKKNKIKIINKDLLTDQYKDIRIIADHYRLKQVLINIISNSIKYNKPKGTVIVKIVENSNDNTILNLEITDTGIGIPQEKMKLLYTPFERLGAENTDIEGTGLGLALTKQLMLRMNSDIYITSEENIGTTIKLPLHISTEKFVSKVNSIAEANTIHNITDSTHIDKLSDDKRAIKNDNINHNRRVSDPILIFDDERTRNEYRKSPLTINSLSTTETKNKRRRKHRILYIEDNYNSFYIVDEFIKKINNCSIKYELMIATTGSQGIELANKYNFKTIIIDLGLPDMNGEDVLLKIKSEGKNIIICSANNNKKRLIEKIHQTNIKMLNKPINLDELYKLISPQQ